MRLVSASRDGCSPHDFVADHAIAIEIEAASEVLLFYDDLVQPKAIIGPHLVQGQCVQWRPQRHGLGRLEGFALPARGTVNADVHGQSISELKPQLAVFHRIQRGYAQLFLSLAHGAFEFRLARIQLAAGAIDFACTEPTLFADEQHALGGFIDDEHEGGAAGGLPVIPVGGHGERKG